MSGQLSIFRNADTGRDADGDRVRRPRCNISDTGRWNAWQYTHAKTHLVPYVPSFTLGTWKYQRINAKNIGILHTDTQRSYVHTCVLTGYPYTCKHACMHFRIEASPYCLFCRILAPQIVHGWVFLGTRDRVWMRACKDAECVCVAHACIR